MEKNDRTLADLQAENEKLRRLRGIYDDLMMHTDAVLHAIEAGDLLAALPSDEHDATRHNAACHLLDMLQDEVRRCLEQVEA